MVLMRVVWTHCSRYPAVILVAKIKGALAKDPKKHLEFIKPFKIKLYRVGIMDHATKSAALSMKLPS